MSLILEFIQFDILWIQNFFISLFTSFHFS